MNPQDACQPTSASPGKTGASMAPPVLQVQGLCAWYGPAQVLHAVDLCVQAGEVVCLLGRNGAGKSTTFKALVGWVTHSVQCLRLAGQEVSDWRTDARARAGLGFVPEDRRIFTELTVLENLRVAAQGHAQTDAPWGVDEVFALFPHLADLRDRLGAHMSGGEQQMLSVARSLMGQPRVLLLDEPSEGVAPVVVEQMAQDLQASYPGMKGFSRTSLFAMRQFYAFFSAQFEVGNVVGLVEVERKVVRRKQLAKSDRRLHGLDRSDESRIDAEAL